MKHVVVCAVVWFAATVTVGQSLGELAKREKKRRAKNQQEGVEVLELTERDVRLAPPLALGPETTAPTEESALSESEAEMGSGIEVEPSPDLPAPSASRLGVRRRGAWSSPTAMHR